MTLPDSGEKPRLFAGRSRILQWGVMLALSGVLVIGLEALHLPAALLLGPMFAAIFLAVSDSTIRVPVPAFVGAQSIVGLMIAQGIPASSASVLAQNWPALVSGIVFVVLAAAVIGWLMARWQVLPGSTAIWGSAPGAASAMTLMAGEYGADMRLVAFMQYLRVACVALATTLLARWMLPGGPDAIPDIIWFPPVDWRALGLTLLVAAVSAILGRRLRIPAGALLLPLIVGIVINETGWLRLTLPPWLLALSYAALGWSIGLRFSRSILVHAAHAAPRVLASILLLMALCAGFATVLIALTDIDPLTAYLATSPGGADTVAIIAASTHGIDVPFVMTMQSMRLVVVILTGPALARLIAHLGGHRQAGSD